MQVSTIGFLHTSPTHVERFEAIVQQVAPDTGVVSVVSQELLTLAIQKGPADPEVLNGVDMALAELGIRGCGVIVCTCSTLGPRAEQRGFSVGLPVLRVDRPMAEAAVRRGPRIAVVATLENTFAPTSALLEAAAVESDHTIVMSIHLVEGAWQRFLDGDVDGYLHQIAAMCDQVAKSCDVVVLAQASMAGAAQMARSDVVILESPGSAVRAAVEAVQATEAHP